MNCRSVLAERPGKGVPLMDVPGRNLGSMVRITGLIITYLQMGYIRVIHPLILTFDPNFQQDIQLGPVWQVVFCDRLLICRLGGNFTPN